MVEWVDYDENVDGEFISIITIHIQSLYIYIYTHVCIYIYVYMMKEGDFGRGCWVDWPSKATALLHPHSFTCTRSCPPGACMDLLAFTLYTPFFFFCFFFVLVLAYLNQIEREVLRTYNLTCWWWDDLIPFRAIIYAHRVDRDLIHRSYDI